MNTRISLAKVHHLPTTIALLAISCLLSSTALAQRPSIAALQGQVGTLQSQVATLQTQVVRDMAGYVTMDTSDHARPTLRVHGANLQVVNDLNNTETSNGLGNVIVGYDEPRTSGAPVCSNGFYTDANDCLQFNYTWAVNHKSGSHNVIVGPAHAYSVFGGLVAGSQNVINNTESSVLGGSGNIASGAFATVSGGNDNTASGLQASVSGGNRNQAAGGAASVSGGDRNTATQTWASVSGGESNIASGQSASVSGGAFDTASGNYSSVSGGERNIASGANTSVSGGNLRTVSTTDFWVGGNVLAPQ